MSHRLNHDDVHSCSKEATLNEAFSPPIPHPKNQKENKDLRHFHWLYAQKSFYFHLKLYLTIILASSIAFSIPLIVRNMFQQAEMQLNDRSQTTPIIVSGLNSPYDLLFSGLYFLNELSQPLKSIQVDEIFELGFATGTPIIIAGKVDRLPLVGTDSSYYHFRNFNFTYGRSPSHLGEVCLSQQIAKERDIKLNTVLSTEINDLFQLTAAYPIDVKVVGIFKSSSVVDQQTVFTNLSTAWSALGHAHSHNKQRGQVDASVVIEQSINRKSHHIHGDPDLLPVSALLLFPKTIKKLSLLKAHLGKKDDQYTYIEPQKVAQKTFKFTKSLSFVLQPLLIILSSLTIFLIVLMLFQHHLSKSQARTSLFAFGLSKRSIFLLSLREYSFFTLCLLILLLLFILLPQYLIDPSILWRLLYL